MVAFMRTIVAAVIATIVAAPLPVSTNARADNGKEIRIVGCVQWEKDYLKKATRFHWDLVLGIWDLGFLCSSHSFMNFRPTDQAFISEMVNPAVPSRNPRLRM